MAGDEAPARPGRALEGSRAAALARDGFGFTAPLTDALPGAAIASEGDRAIAVIGDPTLATVGGVLLWARQAGVTLESVVVESSAGTVDSWLDGFERRPRVFGLAGRDLVDPEPMHPEPVREAPSVPAVLAEAPVDVVVEGGSVTAEVDGLEVARVVVDEEGEPRLEVGVGRYDRAGHGVMSANRPIAETLAEVVEAVARLRRPGAASHSYNRLCRERWLRSWLIADPALVGVVGLVPIDPAQPRANLLEPSPSPALGADEDGSRVLVVASAGIDPGLAPAVAIIAARVSPDRVVVVLPESDVLDPVRRLLDDLRWPLALVAIDPPWTAVPTAGSG